MLEKGRISSRQAILLMISTMLPTAILAVPGVVIERARQDALFSLGLATLAALLISRIVVNLGLRFPNKTLFEYAEVLLGRSVGKVVGFVYLWWLLHTNAIIIDEFASLPCVALMPETPFIVFFAIGIGVAGYAVYNGLEVLGRYNELIAPIGIGLILAMFVLLLGEMKVTRGLPLFEAGLPRVVKGAVTPAAYLGEIIIFSMIIPYVNRSENAQRMADIAVLSTSFLTTLATVGLLAVFGPTVASAWTFPAFNAVRAVVIANVLERLESVVIMVWVLAGIAKIGVFYYAAALGSVQWMGLRDYRPLVAPIGLVLLGLAHLCDNIVDLLDFLARTFPTYALLVFEFGVPLLMLLVVAVKGKRGATDA